MTRSVFYLLLGFSLARPAAMILGFEVPREIHPVASYRTWRALRLLRKAGV